MGKPSREAVVDRERSIVAHAGRDDRYYQAALETGLAAEHFGDDALRALWKAIAGMRDAGARTIRGVDLKARLAADGAPEAAVQALATLREVDSATEEQTRADAAQVMKAAELRVARAELAAGLKALESPDDVDAALRKAREAASRAINYLATPLTAAAGSRSIVPSLSRIFARISDPAARTMRVTGIPTGIRTVDERIRGMQPGKMTIFAARPGAGKSAFATTIVANLVRGFAETGLMPPVLFVSLEMEIDELLQRVLWALSGVPEHVALYGAPPTPAQAAALARAGEWLYAAQGFLEVETQSSWTASQLDHAIRQWHRRRWPRGAPKGAHGLVVLDYIQIVGSDERGADERVQVSETSKMFTAAMKDTGLTGLALAQLNRASEAEQRLPKLSDLRNAGQLEQDGYAIGFLHPLGEEQDALAGREWRGSTLCILAKVRGGGRKGIVPLHYRGECQFFSEWVREAHGSYEELLQATSGPAANRKPKAKKQLAGAA